MKASESPYQKIEWVTTGYHNLDTILGGGIPLRKITEISGQNGVGKSTLMSSIIAEAQKMGMDTCLVDTEFSLENVYAHSLGIDLDKLDLICEKLAEDNLDQAEDWVEKHKRGVIVIDSIGGLLTRDEYEKGNGEKVIGGQAKIIATFCRKIVPMLAINNVALVVLNHEFTDILSGKLKTSGGAKLEYAKSIWLRLRKLQKRVMSGENQVGDIVEAEIRKHKLAPNLKKSVELTFLYGQGFMKGADLMEEAKEKLFEKRGQFYFWGEEKIARGDKGLRELFSDASFKEKVSAAL